VLFLSDVRPKLPPGQTTAGLTAGQKKAAFHDDFSDMEKQRAWVETMRPRQALLRFRVPYEVIGLVIDLVIDLVIRPVGRLVVPAPDLVLGQVSD
jgi:hypothetical protein